MTREEFGKVYSEKSEQIIKLKGELLKMKKQYIEEHKQIKQTPSKIHYIHSYIGWMKQPVMDEKDGYIVGYDIYEGSNSQEFNNKVFPVINEVKKDGTMSSREHYYPKVGILKFWEIGNENAVYEINFGKD